MIVTNNVNSVPIPAKSNKHKRTPRPRSSVSRRVHREFYRKRVEYAFPRVVPVKHPYSYCRRHRSMRYEKHKVVSKFLYLLSNFSMRAGGKLSACKTMKEFFSLLKENFRGSPKQTLIKAILILKPAVQLRVIVKSGLKRRIPAIFSSRKQPISIAQRWLQKSAAERYDRGSVAYKLYLETSALLKHKGKALAKRYNWNACALDNKFFIKYLFPQKRRFVGHTDYSGNMRLRYNRFRNEYLVLKFVDKAKTRNALTTYLMGIRDMDSQLDKYYGSSAESFRRLTERKYAHKQRDPRTIKRRKDSARVVKRKKKITKGERV